MKIYKIRLEFIAFTALNKTFLVFYVIKIIKSCHCLSQLSEYCFDCKKHKNRSKLFFCYESKAKVGPINNKVKSFKCGNIFCGHVHSSPISMSLIHAVLERLL